MHMIEQHYEQIQKPWRRNDLFCLREKKENSHRKDASQSRASE